MYNFKLPLYLQNLGTFYSTQDALTVLQTLKFTVATC